MESIFTINEPMLLNYMVSQLLPPFVNNRRIITEAYNVTQIDENSQEQTLMYVYDCRLFRSCLFSKEDSEFISSFLVLYKEDFPIYEHVFELVDPNNVQAGTWLLKVKESGLLRVFSYLRDNMRRLRHKFDKIILPEDKYYPFMQEWMKYHYSYNL